MQPSLAEMVALGILIAAEAMHADPVGFDRLRWMDEFAPKLDELIDARIEARLRPLQADDAKAIPAK